LKSSDRFNPHAQGGISLRWLPGSDAATYCAQGDEHNSMGAVDESGLNAKLQMEKRLRKLHGLKMGLPAPHLSVGGRSAKTTDWMDAGDEIELLAIGWGSTGDVFRDVMCSDELRGRKIAYLHYTYLWPLRTQELQRFAKRSKRIDGRPFFHDELLASVMERCAATAENEGNCSSFGYAGTSS
jgi:2-oxoglutarate ferredoxin oxidoreductase subunit alpha